jgi:4-amino-4-deoxy-L-arabinose transferase-like glycosyltransferase
LKRSTILLASLLVVAALGLHLSVSWQDFATLAKNGYLYDDSFYAFQIARNVAEGRGVTFDGVTPTNGFQPLYVFSLVPFYWISGHDSVLPIYAALTILALLTVATSVLLFLIVRRYTSDAVALVASLVWVFSPVVVRQSSNGLETAMVMFFIAWSLYFYLDRIRNHTSGSKLDFLKLGTLLGLTVLARVDGIFLVLAMSLDYLLVVRARFRAGDSSVPGLLRGIAVAAAAAFVVYLPWLLYSVDAVGSPFQESGTATRFLSIAYAPFFDMGTADVMNDGPGLPFVWAHVEHALGVLKISPPFHVFFRAVEKMTGGGPLSGWWLVVMNVAGLAGLCVFAVWLIRSRPRDRWESRRELMFLLLFAVMLIAAYASYVFGVFFFMRYFYPVYFVATIFAACMLHDVIVWLSRRQAFLKYATAGLVALYAAGLVYMGVSCGFRSSRIYHFYDVAGWVEQNTAEDETIGVFQGGAIGYFSNRRVVNLDGKVNGDALAALKSGKLCEYIVDAGIDIVLDHTNVIALFIGEQGETRLAGESAPRCFTGETVGAPGWTGFRVDKSIAGAGTLRPVSGTSSGSSRLNR